MESLRCIALLHSSSDTKETASDGIDNFVSANTESAIAGKVGRCNSFSPSDFSQFFER